MARPKKLKFPCTMTVNVTARDIAKGCIAEGQACPIARAVNRRLPQSSIASVGLYQIFIYGRNHRKVSAFLPTEARRFVRDYDDGREVRPFKFTLELKEEPLEWEEEEES